MRTLNRRVEVDGEATAAVAASVLLSQRNGRVEWSRAGAPRGNAA